MSFSLTKEKENKPGTAQLGAISKAQKQQKERTFKVSKYSVQKENFFEKSLTMPKENWKGPFRLARYCMLRGKTGKLFWFSSFSQQVQFGAYL